MTVAAMERLWCWLGMGAACLLASACSLLTVAGLGPGDTCGEAAARQLRTVDWGEAMVVPLQLRSGEFQPMVIDLRRGRPYRLLIHNVDDELRVFHAPAFLAAVAIAGISVDDTERDDRCIGMLWLPPQAKAEIRLLPRQRGRFGFADTLVPLDAWGTGLGAITVY